MLFGKWLDLVAILYYSVKKLCELLLSYLVTNWYGVQMVLCCLLVTENEVLRSLLIPYILSTSEIGNCRLSYSEGCAIAYSVWKFMSELELNGLG